MSFGKSVAACVALTATLLAPARGRAEDSKPGAASTPGAAPATTAVHAILGQTRSEVKRGEFVSFFHFVDEQDLTDPAHPGRHVYMLSNPGQFHGMATLILSTAEGEDRILSAGLMVRRDFIDDPGTQPFARDIVKSFLELSPGAGRVGQRRVIEEISKGCGGDRSAKVVRLGDDAAPACPAADALAEGTRAFLGLARNVLVAGKGDHVQLQNATVMEVPMLFVEIGPDEPAR